MKPNLGDPYPPTWAGYPPQISANDFQIWAVYRDLHFEEFKQFYYNVPVGDPLMWTEGLEEEMARMVEHLSRRRIDVVGEKDNGWWLIELRANAGPGAIGSILTYKALWEEDPPDTRPVVPVIITDTRDDNIARACYRYGIIYILS